MSDLQLANAPTFHAPVVAPIQTTEEYVAYGHLLKSVKQYKATVEAFYAPHKARARSAWQGLIDDEKAKLEPAVQAETNIKRELVAYDDTQERLRQAEQRRLEIEQRQRDEAQRLEEAAALELEADRTGDEQLRAEAQQLMAEPVDSAPVQLASFTPKVSGLSYRENWSGRVTDIQKLIQFVAEHPEHTHLLDVNQTALNAMARAQKGNMRIPGAVAESKKIPASGR